MRTRTLRTTVLLAVLALTPALASARPWNESGERQDRVQIAQESRGASFWQALFEGIAAIFEQDGAVIYPTG